MTANTISLGIIGFGEVGTIFARELLATGKTRIAAYDILFDDPASAEAMKRKAEATGVRYATSAADAAAGASIIISAVTADAVAKVASEAATYLTAGQIFFDINSASPGTKKAAFHAVAKSGAKYVEGAVMAPVPGPDLKVPILGGCPAAAETAEILNGLGMNIKPVSDEPGRASAMKLCRSIMIKGIEALIVDCAKAAKAWDVEREVYGSLNASFPCIDFADAADYMAGRVREHGVRRAAEMREAAMMLDDIGVDSALATAIADAQDRGAERKRKS